MNKKLFVGRLPFGFSNDQLRNLFIKLGTVVSAVMVPDAKSGKTRGFGFVDMNTEAEAHAAIQSLNGTPLEDKKIWVTLAREKGDAKPATDFPKTGRRSFGDRPFNDRPFGGERPSFGDRPQRRPFTDRSGPPRFGAKPGFGPKKYSPSGPTNGRRMSGDHFTDGPSGAPHGDRKPPKKDFRSRDIFRGPPKRTGGRRPPARP